MDIDTLYGLKECSLFKGLSDDEIIDIAHTIHYRVIRYRKGDLFTYAGSICLHADIILKGKMLTSMTSQYGRTIRVSTLERGSILAPAFLFIKENVYPVSIEANEDTQIFRMSPADFEQIIKSDPRISMNFIRILSEIISKLTKKVNILSMNIREKLIFYLKEESKHQKSKCILLTTSRQELAEQFGIQKYSLLRCLKELQEEGAIKVDGKKIEIIKL